MYSNIGWFFRLSVPDQRDAFGIIVSYAVKVKLYLGALGGELAAELPFVLMHPKVTFAINTTQYLCESVCKTDYCFLQPNKRQLLHADSQADVETFRQDTIDQDNEVDDF